MPRLPPAIVAELGRKAGADRWALSADELAPLLEASLQHAFSQAEPSRHEVQRHLASLHVADLALAGACALGREAAWDHFVIEHRPVLYRAADALDPTGGARELADALYADLYGMRQNEGGRQSLFRYFHGRSSLATWLRAVLAQRHVDALRAQKRLEPFPDDESAAPEVPVVHADPDRARLVPLLERALQAAIDGLPARDRLRLRSYYVAQLTLAEIGRITGEHEATVSRHLARTRRTVRGAVEQSLRDEAGLTREQIARGLELALEDPEELDLQQVFERAAERKESPPDRSRSDRERLKIDDRG
jgi:RNA polymerase sigma-70 factor (ECF subfamily)